MNLTTHELKVLRTFYGTGRYVGKDALLKDRLPKRGTDESILISLRKKGLLEHFVANRWYLTERGRDLVYGRVMLLAEEGR